MARQYARESGPSDMPDELRPDIPPDAVFETDVPARLDRLPWSRFHWLVIVALGIAWVLDGLEVTIVGSLSGALTESPVLHLTGGQVGLAASAYLIGAVRGAVLRLADRPAGRKKLFSITVLVYLIATIACGLSWNFWSFALFRLLTGAGIGGEYAAVNATIQELIPARRRGFTDLVVNGSFWLGAAVGAIGALVVLDPAVMPAEYGWRFAFIIGGVLGFIVLLLRRFLPESPRWLMTHGHPEEAERVVAEIERRVERETGRPLPPVPHQKLLAAHRRALMVRPGDARAVHRLPPPRRARHRADGGAGVLLQRGVLHLRADPDAVLRDRVGDIGWFMLPFAAGNFLGPLVLGRLFDTLGRRLMITATYALSGILMALTGWLFALGVLDAVQQTLAWTVIFFVASAAASSAYLTVGESFPLEMRAIAIALFYAFGTGVGGVAGPALFGALIDTGARVSILWGYLLGGALMVGAAVVAALLAVPAERRALEDIAPPLSSAVR